MERLSKYYFKIHGCDDLRRVVNDLSEFGIYPREGMLNRWIKGNDKIVVYEWLMDLKDYDDPSKKEVSFEEFVDIIKSDLNLPIVNDFSMDWCGDNDFSASWYDANEYLPIENTKCIFYLDTLKSYRVGWRDGIRFLEDSDGLLSTRPIEYVSHWMYFPTFKSGDK